MEENRYETENVNNEANAPKENVNPQNNENQNSAPQGNYNNYDWRYGYPDQVNRQNYNNQQYNNPYNNPGVNYNNQAPYGQQSNQNYQYQNPQYANNQYQAPNYSEPQYNPYNNQPYQGPVNNPYGGYNYYQPQPYQQKNRIIAGLFGIVMGGIGLHNFYLGYTGRAIAQLLVSFFTCGLGSIWGFIEGILIIAGAYKNNLDANGFYTKDI